MEFYKPKNIITEINNSGDEFNNRLDRVENIIYKLEYKQV